MDSQPAMFIGGPHDGAVYPVPIVPPFNRPPDFFLLPKQGVDAEKIVEYMMISGDIWRSGVPVDRLYRYNLRQSKYGTIESLDYEGVVHLYEYGRMKARIEGGPAPAVGGTR